MTVPLHQLPATGCVFSAFQVKGPMGHFEYKGMGKCELHGKEYTLKKIGLMAGG